MRLKQESSLASGIVKLLQTAQSIARSELLIKLLKIISIKLV